MASTGYQKSLVCVEAMTGIDRDEEGAESLTMNVAITQKQSCQEPENESHGQDSLTHKISNSSQRIYLSL